MALQVTVGANTSPMQRDVFAAIDRINRSGKLKINIDDKGVTRPLGNMRRSADEFTKSLEAKATGKVVDYKITDGQGIGFIVQFSDASIHWFFDYEIEQKSQPNATNNPDYENDENLINPNNTTIYKSSKALKLYQIIFSKK